MKEFLLAESGSTKTHWIQYSEGKEYSFYTSGLNPNHHSNEAFIHKLADEVEPYPFTGPIYFYGAGCSTTEQKNRVKKLLAQHFNLKKINVYSDLEGACIAASNYSPAIVGILGTGASCCRFNGKEVTEQAPSLGYLLGDEGSGASFGKRLVSAYLRKEMPARLKNLFEEGFDTHLLLQKIYLNKQPAAYLASFFPFIESYRKFDFINELIHDEINRFIDLHISPLKPKKTDSIHFCGSVAYLLQDEIKIHLKSRKLQSGQFIQHPAAALVKFLANQKS